MYVTSSEEMLLVPFFHFFHISHVHQQKRRGFKAGETYYHNSWQLRSMTPTYFGSPNTVTCLFLSLSLSHSLSLSLSLSLSQAHTHSSLPLWMCSIGGSQIDATISLWYGKKTDWGQRVWFERNNLMMFSFLLKVNLFERWCLICSICFCAFVGASCRKKIRS